MAATTWRVQLLLRLALRPDRLAIIAVAGIAAALLLPAAGVLVVSGLEPQVSGHQWLVADHSARDGIALEPGATAAVRFQQQQDIRLAAVVVGDGPPPGVAWSERSDQESVLVAGEHLLVEPHPVPALALPTDIVVPIDLMPGPPHAALYPHPVADSVPARGPDAFEVQELADLRQSLVLVVFASIPLVAFLSGAFADQDARRHTRTAATLSALGRPDLGRSILAARALAVTGLGLVAATCIAYALWRWGGTTFHPRNTPEGLLALALGLPAVAGGAVGVWAALRRVGDANAQLRERADLPQRSPRVPFLPISARPLLLGWRVLAPLCLAAMVFVLDVGFPVAAAGIPASIAGGDGEYVQGMEGSFGGTAVDVGPGDLLGRLDAVEASIAEVVLATLVSGHGMVVRGAHWDAAASYYGLELHGTSDGLVLGKAAAARTDLKVGEVVTVQGHARIAWVPVTGILTGPSLLEDEGILPRGLAQDLTGLDRGQANAVRVRPATPAVQDAMAAPGRIEVADLRLPGGLVAGTEATATIDVVNLGSSTADRNLVLRVDGLVADTVLVRLAAFTERTVQASFIVPEGTFQVQVNPTEDGRAAPSAGTLFAESPVFTGEDIQVHASDGAGAAVHLLHQGIVQDEAILDADGQAGLTPTTPGDHRVVARGLGLAAPVTVLDAANRTTPALRIQEVWIDGSAVVGSLVELHARVQNLGGAAGRASVPFHVDGRLLTTEDVQLDPGQSRDLVVPYEYRQGTVDVGGVPLALAAPPGQVPEGLRRSEDVQDDVADRILGDATRALGALGATAMVSTIAVVYVATHRTVSERAFIARVLAALGQDEASTRRRIAWEAALLGAGAFLVGAAGGALLFAALGAFGWPAPFAHSLPQPLDGILVMQVATAFAGASALAAYLAHGSKSLSDPRSVNDRGA